MARLIIQFQGEEWATELNEGSNSVGRQSSSEVPIKDTTLSRYHCEVVLSSGVATLFDKGSMNGTLLNGKRISEQPLQAGDKIVIGATTLWFERKNDSSSTATPQPHGEEGAAQSLNVASERDAASGIAPPSAVPSAPTATTTANVPPSLKDYSFHSKSGGPWGRIVAVVAVLAALGVAGYLGRGLLAGPSTPSEDRDNLVFRNPSFNVSSDFWQLRPSFGGGKASCILSVDATRGRDGGPCLVVDKSGGASELVGECAYSEEFALGRGSLVDVWAWTQFENFSGSAAVKIDWLRAVRGPVVAEEFSDLVSKCSTWTEIKAAFTPPAGAGAFRVALAVVGRSGRILFDDVSVKTREGSPSGPDKKLGSHKVNYTRQGVLQIELRGGRRMLANVGLRLESEKEGATAQSFATDVAVTVDESGLLFQGRLPNPLDFREVPFEQRVVADEDGTAVVYRFRGDALRQVDRVTIVLTLPRVEALRGLPEADDAFTSRVIATAEDGDFAIEYLDPARVKSRVIDGRTRLVQTWTVDGRTEDPAFGFRIRESSGAGSLDPQQTAQDLHKRGKSGEALTLLRDQIRKKQEVSIREKIEAEIVRLEEAEHRDWADLQARAFHARISRRAELVAQALQSIDAFLRQWAREGTEKKAEGLREEIKKELASAPGAETERLRRIFNRARRCVETDRRALAQALLQGLLARHPDSDIAVEAKELLKTLNP